MFSQHRSRAPKWLKWRFFSFVVMKHVLLETDSLPFSSVLQLKRLAQRLMPAFSSCCDFLCLIKVEILELIFPPHFCSIAVFLHFGWLHIVVDVPLKSILAQCKLCKYFHFIFNGSFIKQAKRLEGYVRNIKDAGFQQHWMASFLFLLL